MANSLVLKPWLLESLRLNLYILSKVWFNFSKNEL